AAVRLSPLRRSGPQDPVGDSCSGPSRLVQFLKTIPLGLQSRRSPNEHSDILGQLLFGAHDVTAETSYETLLGRLVEAADAPLPSRATSLEALSKEEARKNTVILILLALGLGCTGGVLWHFGHTIWGGIAGGIGLLFAIVSLSPKALVAPCPYCSHRMGGQLESDETKELHCEKCFEYSILEGKTVRPLDPSTVSETPRFEAPVFQNLRWPKACVACGTPPTPLAHLPHP